MAIFLNTTSPLENYRSIVSARFFADKTWLLDEILETVKTDNRRYICITRPRCFGKTVMANMGPFWERLLMENRCLIS
jgi:hypothetical protein